MSERIDEFKEMVRVGLTDKAFQMVRDAADYLEAERFVGVVLQEVEPPAELLVEAVLESFLNSHQACEYKPYHGYWVHSLSHFTNILWERRMDGWIKKFNDVAFRYAIATGDSNCSARLACDFAHFAKFDDDPADFFLTAENLRWMDWKYYQYQKARIDAAPFQSEEVFLRWKLHRPETHTAFDYDAQTGLVNLDGIRSIVQRLQELGADTSEFNSLERDLLTKQLNELEGKLPATTQDWQRERLEKGIQKTRAGLEALA